MLLMLCIANINATRFLEDTETVSTSTQTNNTEQTDTNSDKKNPQEDVNGSQVIDDVQKQGTKDQAQAEHTTEQKSDNNKQDVQEKEKEETTQVITPQEEKKETKQETEEKQEDEKIISPTPDNKESSYFGLSFGFILILAACVLFFFVGFYRYSLRKYKIPPFTPPNFCPNFLFPRPENDLLMEDYCIQSGAEIGGVYSSEKYHNFY
ncbi:hypothetical protein ABPG72_009535 [Tetrahymena utriculariae]